MAETPISFDVVAFVQMHGAVKPTKLVSSPSQQTLTCGQYQLTGKPLPRNTTLCAPKILGKSYHATNTSPFISTLRLEWNKHPLPRASFSDFCLSKLNAFEQTQRGLMKQEMESSDFIQIMEVGYTPARIKHRLVLEGAIVQKSEIKWDEHECSIAEKSYYVVADGSIQNCIMFFCNGIELRPTLQKPTVNISNGRRIIVWVSYDNRTKLFKITFDNTQKNEFSFEDLNMIVRGVLTHVTHVTPDEFKLTIFDFTCCVALFPDNDDCLIGLTPQLLSSTMLSNSGDGRPKLIYGTIREDRLHNWESHVGRLSAGNTVDAAHNVYAGPASEHDSFTQQSLSLSQSQSESQSQYTAQSLSPAQPPTPSIVVELIGHVDSFADFEPISTRVGRSRSVSPSGGVGVGGRGRTRKKAHRKQITRRRRHTNRRLHTKGSIRRTRK